MSDTQVKGAKIGVVETDGRDKSRKVVMTNRDHFEPGDKCHRTFFDSDHVCSDCRLKLDPGTGDRVSRSKASDLHTSGGSSCPSPRQERQNGRHEQPDR